MTPTVTWQYKLDLRLKDGNAKAWADYDAIDSAGIEANWQKFLHTAKPTAKQRRPKLNATYDVNFDDMLQQRNDDP